MKKFELHSYTGMVFFDNNLSFDKSLSLGLGAGHGITNFLQLNLAFLFSPTQQHISLATAKLTSNAVVFHYSLDVRLSTSKSFLARVKPFLKSGIGGVSFIMPAVTLNLGGGNRLHLDGQADHLFTIAIGGGILIGLSPRLNLILEYRSYFFRLNKVLDDGISAKAITARNNFLGIGLTAAF